MLSSSCACRRPSKLSPLCCRSLPSGSTSRCVLLAGAVHAGLNGSSRRGVLQAEPEVLQEYVSFILKAQALLHHDAVPEHALHASQVLLLPATTALAQSAEPLQTLSVLQPSSLPQWSPAAP